MTRVEQKFKIGTVAKLTGISTHALRIWEKRYGLAPSQRAPGGGRLYTQAEVARLELIKRLLDQGHAISQIAHLAVKDLSDLVQRVPEPMARTIPIDPALVVYRFLEAISDLQLLKADRILGHAAITLEPRQLIDEVLVPIFEQIGARWATGALSVAEEHAASVVLRNHLGQLMGLFAADGGRGPVVTATLTGERHEFGALLAALTSALSGYRVLHLGADLPAREIATAARTCTAEIVMVSLVCHDVTAELARLRKLLPRRVELVAGGKAATTMRQVPGVKIVPTLAELEDWLTPRGQKSIT